MLRILGEKHRLYDFLSALSMKCSYLLFNKEQVKELLLEVAVQKSAGNGLYISSCMNILVVKTSQSFVNCGQNLYNLSLTISIMYPFQICRLLISLFFASNTLITSFCILLCFA